MKKTIKILALALVAVLAVAMLVACGPASNPDKAEKALEGNGYAVAKVTSALILDPQAIAAGLEKGDIVATITASNKDGEMISITYFKSSSVASKYWKEHKDEVPDDDKVVVKKSGKMIYFGTKQAIKDAK